MPLKHKSQGGGGSAVAEEEQDARSLASWMDGNALIGKY